MEISKPDLFERNAQYDDICAQWNGRFYETAQVKENFDLRRKHSAEGYEVKIGIGDVCANEWVIVQEYTNPLHEERDVRQMHVPLEALCERGLYVYWLNEPWIIYSEKRYIDGAYWSVQIRKCNYLMSWVDWETRKVVRHWVVLLRKNSYSSGVWANAFAQYVDGKIACVIPSQIDEVKRVTRDDRRLISFNKINPASFRISSIQDTVCEGLTLWNFEEDEPSPAYDDYENMIADRWRLDDDI